MREPWFLKKVLPPLRALQTPRSMHARESLGGENRVNAAETTRPCFQDCFEALNNGKVRVEPRRPQKGRAKNRGTMKRAKPCGASPRDAQSNEAERIQLTRQVFRSGSLNPVPRLNGGPFNKSRLTPSTTPLFTSPCQLYSLTLFENLGFEPLKFSLEAGVCGRSDVDGPGGI